MIKYTTLRVEGWKSHHIVELFDVGYGTKYRTLCNKSIRTFSGKMKGKKTLLEVIRSVGEHKNEPICKICLKRAKEDSISRGEGILTSFVTPTQSGDFFKKVKYNDK